jgi:hypothetical protein
VLNKVTSLDFPNIETPLRDAKSGNGSYKRN